MENDVSASTSFAHAGLDDFLGHREADDDEGELAARTEQRRGLDRRRPGHAEQAQQHDQHARLDDDQPEKPEHDRQRVAPQVGDVEAHADGEEEHAEQEALERFDRRLDGAVILGLGQQQSGDESAQRHRQAGGGRDEAAADGDEQRRGDEQLG